MLEFSSDTPVAGFSRARSCGVQRSMMRDLSS